jgi:hypothetical protein
VARWFRNGLSVSAPFVWRCLNIPSMLRFHIPLIEPDVQISRIRLSDKVSCFRPRKIVCSHFQPDQSQGLIQDLIREACCSLSWYLVLVTQPLAKPFPGVSNHRRRVSSLMALHIRRMAFFDGYVPM